MIRRFELTDKQFAALADLLPANGKRGGRWNDHRTTLNDIFWWLYTGAQWREVPERYAKAKSLYDRFNFWRADNTLDRILERLHLQLNKEGRLDMGLRGVDATSIRASRAAAGAARGKKKGYDPADQALGRSCGGWGTKVHLVVDGHDIPFWLRPSPPVRRTRVNDWPPRAQQYAPAQRQGSTDLPAQKTGGRQRL